MLSLGAHRQLRPTYALDGLNIAAIHFDESV
jgi:hypothetical protein